ncbi:unnamed protein product [Dicrocoelium dendriticum]|nr:unnamed protein product [Dicrocoelium dendriticum]
MGESVAEIKQTVTVGEGQIIASKHETKRLTQDGAHQMNNEGRARVTTETQVDLMEKIVVTNDTLVGWPIRLSSVNVHEHEEQQIVSLDDARQAASPTKANVESSSKPMEFNDGVIQPSLSMSVQVGSVFNHQLLNGTGFNIQTRVELRSTSPEHNFMVQNVVGSFTFTADPEGTELPAPSGPASERVDQPVSQGQSATNSVIRAVEIEDSRTEVSQSEHTITESKLVARTTENFENKHMHGSQVGQGGIWIKNDEALSKQGSDLPQYSVMSEPPAKTERQHSCVADCACPFSQAELIGGQATVCDELPQQVVQTQYEGVGPLGVTVDRVPVSKSEENIELKLGHLASAQSQESERLESRFGEVPLQATQADDVDRQEPATGILHNTRAEHNPSVKLIGVSDEDKAESLIVLAKTAEENKPVSENEVEGAVKSERSSTKDTPTLVESYQMDRIEEKPMSTSHSVLNVVDSGEETVVATKVDQDEQWAEQSVKGPLSETLQEPVSATSPEVLDVPQSEKQNVLQSPGGSQTEQPLEVHYSGQISDEAVSGKSKSEEQLYQQVARRITNDVLQKSQQQTLQQSRRSSEEPMNEFPTVEMPGDCAPSIDLQSTAAPVLAAQQNMWPEEGLDPVPKIVPTKTMSNVDSSKQSPMLRDAQVNTGRELSPATEDEVNNESEWSHSMHHYRHHHRHYRAGSGGERTHHSGFSPPCCGARKEAQSNRVVCHFGHGKTRSHKPKRLSRSCTQLRGQEMVLCGCSRCCGSAVPYEAGAGLRVVEDHSDDTSSTTQTASETSEMQRMTMTLLTTIATTAELLRKQYKKQKVLNAKATGKRPKRLDKGEPTDVNRIMHQNDLEGDEIHGVQNTSCAEPYSIHDSAMRYPEFVQNFRITIPAEWLSVNKNKNVTGRLESGREHGVQCDLTSQSQQLSEEFYGLGSRFRNINKPFEHNPYESEVRGRLGQKHREQRHLKVGVYEQRSLRKGRRVKAKFAEECRHSVSGSLLPCTVQEIAEEDLSLMLTTVNCCLETTRNSQADSELDKARSSTALEKPKSPAEMYDTVASAEQGKMSSEDFLHYGMEVRSPSTPSVVIDHSCPSQPGTPSYDTSYVTPSIQSRQSIVDQCILGPQENDLSKRGWAPVSNSAYLWCAREGRHARMISVQFNQECSKPNPSAGNETLLNGIYSKPVWHDCASARDGAREHQTLQPKVKHSIDLIMFTKSQHR